MYSRKSGGGTQVEHKWSPFENSILVGKYLVVGRLLYLGLYSRSEQADNEFYRVRGYMSCNRVAVSYAGGGGRSDLPDGLRQAGTTNDGRDEDSKTMRITTHCHGLYPRLQVHARPSKTTILNTSPSPCGSTIGGDSSNITTRPILK